MQGRVLNPPFKIVVKILEKFYVLQAIGLLKV